MVALVKLGGQANPLQFSEFIHLVPMGPGAFCVTNDFFRLIYG